MPSSNPTKTRTIEKNWNREINLRFARLSKSAIAALTKINDGEMIVNQIELSAAQLRTYMVFLEREIARIILGTDQAPNWQARYQLQSYYRGLNFVQQSLIAQGADILPTFTEEQAALALQQFTVTPSLGVAGLQSIHQDALEFLFTRSYESLKGWTDKMARDVRQIVFDGVQQGKGIRVVAKEIQDRVKVTRSRARLIAQTEVIQAWQNSSANETQRSSEELGEEILMRWLTRRDDRVRHRHAAWHGKLMTPKEYKKKINVSPYNCRCGSAPVIKEANTKKKQERFDKEREVMLRLERD